MSEKTKIQWCDSTLNFWSGCTKVSEGCRNCYAERWGKRFGVLSAVKAAQNPDRATSNGCALSSSSAKNPTCHAL
jgi:protein gp37